MSTRIEKLAPEITTLAASIGQTVHYYGGDYFMVPCQRSLWNTRQMGKLTPEGARIACNALRRMVGYVKPAQSLSLEDRVDAVAQMLAESQWMPQHIMRVTTEAQDAGTLSMWLGKWSVQISIVGGPDVEARDVSGTRAEAIEAARSLALAGRTA